MTELHLVVIQKLNLVFTNKTDSGIDLGLTVEMYSDGDEANNTDEASLSISGGFGKIVLGQNDGVGDNYGVASTDLPLQKNGAYAGVGLIMTWC